MKKWMKKAVAVVLTTAMTLSVGIPAFAENQDDISNIKIVISEYDMIKEMANENTAELQAQGYSTKEISAIRNYQETFQEYFKALDKLDDTVLHQ